MPTISSFFGIVIRIYYDDHSPPHFHAYYADDSAQISIESLEVIGGSLPRRALALALEWALAHQRELREDWLLASEHRPLFAIDPLE